MAQPSGGSQDIFGLLSQGFQISENSLTRREFFFNIVEFFNREISRQFPEDFWKSFLKIALKFTQDNFGKF